MTTLTEFLLSRIAEDEDAAERGRSHNGRGVFANDNYGCLLVQPGRVLAECAAKRDIIEWAAGITSLRMMGDPDAPRPVEMDVLKVMACVWADHEEFDPRWQL